MQTAEKDWARNLSNKALDDTIKRYKNFKVKSNIPVNLYIALVKERSSRKQN